MTTPAANYSLLSLIRSYFNASPIQSSTSEVSTHSLIYFGIVRKLTSWPAGFQLLHAVYIVEKLLQELLSRRCRFQIVCFDQNEELCIPTNSHQTDYPKYALARSVIFRHLARNVNLRNRIVIKRFASFTDAVFVQYLDESDPLFVMCHDGAMAEDSVASSCATHLRKVNLRAMLSWFISNQFNVALINELRCSDSKVCYLFVLPRYVLF